MPTAYTLCPLALPPAVPGGLTGWRLDWPPTAQADPAALSPAERERVARYRRPADALPFALTRAALRQLLAARLDMAPAAVVIDRDARGKPFMAAAGAPEFSVSHAAGCAVILLSSAGPVGVDIEPERPLSEWEEAAPVYLTVAEQAAVAALPPQRRSREYAGRWTAKEAVLKLLGLGIGEHLADLALHRDDGVWRVSASAALPVAGVRCAALPVAPGWTGALAWTVSAGVAGKS